jgi:hypothetical protein
MASGHETTALARRALRLTTVLVALVVGVAAHQISISISGSSTPTPPISALAACQSSGLLPKGGTTLSFGGRLLITQEHPDESVLLLASADSVMLCQALRSPYGEYGNVTTSLTLLAPRSEPSLTYDTGTDPAAGSGGPLIVVGRTPPLTARVEVISADGSVATATLDDGFYLAWLDSDGPVTDITARNAQGQIVGELSDPNGIEAGQSPNPGASY